MANLPEEIIQIAATYGYGGSVADSLYALCSDGTVWARMATRGSKWEQVSLEMIDVEPGAERTKL